MAMNSCWSFEIMTNSTFQLRSVEETTQAMAFDGIILQVRWQCMNVYSVCTVYTVVAKYNFLQNLDFFKK